MSLVKWSKAALADCRGMSDTRSSGERAVYHVRSPATNSSQVSSCTRHQFAFSFTRTSKWLKKLTNACGIVHAVEKSETLRSRI
jgi:hypothetical protein